MIYINIEKLTTLKCKDYKPNAGESEKGRCEKNRDKLEADVDKTLKTSVESDKESDNLEGQGMKIIIPSSIIDIYNRLEVLLGNKI